MNIDNLLDDFFFRSVIVPLIGGMVIGILASSYFWIFVGSALFVVFWQVALHFIDRYREPDWAKDA